MRFIAGFLCLALAADVLAQARGDVESVGFDGRYRPGCWTPMVVRLTPTTGSIFKGRIEVIQEDLDRDQVLFTRQIALTGNPPDGTAREERFWMYFIPQPTKERGELRPGLTTAELTEIIKVRLCTDSGKVLVKLPITQPIAALDATGGAERRGDRAVLYVYDQHVPDFSEYRQALGLTEEIQPIGVKNLSSGLPDDVRGYDGIDTILWTDANASNLGSDQTTALENFVRRGGKLVVCQDTLAGQYDRGRANAQFTALLPVVVTGVEQRDAADDKLQTLRRLAGVRPNSAEAAIWNEVKGPFRYATAEVKPAANVVEWQTDDKGNPTYDPRGRGKPYLVRTPLGAGSVTWVAQDLGDVAIRLTTPKPPVTERRLTPGWTRIWNRVIDWPDDPTYDSAAPNSPAAAYRDGVPWETGRAFLGSLNLDNTSAALIGIAILFFIGYWVAAGPGSFLILLKKGRSSLSWFTFAAIAILATGMTVGIVKLVLRGAPQLKHVSVVRVAPSEPANVHSRLGLYVPRDGPQRVELKDARPGRSSYITAFNLHPAFNNEPSDFPARTEYEVPVREIAREEGRDVADPRVISVPYRSTLKKLTANWVGDLPAGIAGKVTLAEDAPKIRGTLRNDTGVDLRNVYLAVHHPKVRYVGNELVGEDVVLFLSAWDKGAAVVLDELFAAPAGDPAKRAADMGGMSASAVADLLDRRSGGARVWGYILPDRETRLTSWTHLWYKDRYREGWSGGEIKDDDLLNSVTFPLLSFFDRLPPSKSSNAGGRHEGRFDLLRRGVRDLDLSAAIGAGQMVVIATASNNEQKLPFPIEVAGDRVDGKGITFYQVVVPVDRAPVQPTPTTKPASAASQSTPEPVTPPSAPAPKERKG